ncbi:GNAT family N-acetyltransferase [Leekyejoonella antrihumi]|uniref:GNAT family N-acetyltransferase n=1 Tax=Leekyejoonella antrihumi TaxID=1660198 RepID=UPI001645BAA1|nr:GNAT family N-acetyltransferase [Leekyejoonella antrihumi]
MNQVNIRPRQDTDIPMLADILERQQSETEYPFEWPMPYPTEQFIHRPSELRSWVAELNETVVGHVAVQTVQDDDLGRMWADAHDVPIRQLRCISVLFADRRYAGQGIGSALLRTATESALADGGAPVLDVVAHHAAPLNLYRRRGWQEIGRYRTDWLPDDVEPVYVMILPRDQTVVPPEATA